MVLRSAGNDQLEPFQVIDLSPTLERIQKILVIVFCRRVVPQTTTLVQSITGSSSLGTSLSVDNGVSIRNLNLPFMSDGSGTLLFWTRFKMCWRTEGYRRARPRATTRQKASVVMVVDCVRSKRNDMTWRSCPCSRAVILAANADFPTPGDPLIQITLWLSTLWISFSISCRTVVRVPSIHGLRRKSLFSPRARTKTSNSCSAITFTFSERSYVSQWFLNINRR